jgi:hypothetical protein
MTRALGAAAAILLVACLAISLASCSDEKDGASKSAGSQQQDEPQVPESGGNGDGGDSGNGGDSSNGGIDGGLGAAQGDDVNATTTRLYSEEAQRQVAEFQEIALGLSMDDVASALELLQAFRELAVSDGANDELFFAYEESMQSIAESMNSDLENGYPDAAAVTAALENGFLFVDEIDSPHFILRSDFFCDTFSEYAGTALKDLLELRKKHYYFAGEHDFIESSTLMVTLDQLAEMIIDWENYINRYGTSGEMPSGQIGDIANNLDYYFQIYIGSNQIENSGFYTYVGVDIGNDTIIRLADEPMQSYIKFIENYPDSRFHPIVSELLQIYRAHDFVYTVDIENFFTRNGFEYA